jgi:hypothetical protein
MKKITNYALHSHSLTIFSLNAQTDENLILSTEDVQKNALIVTPEITEMLITQAYSQIYDCK